MHVAFYKEVILENFCKDNMITLQILTNSITTFNLIYCLMMQLRLQLCLDQIET